MKTSGIELKLFHKVCLLVFLSLGGAIAMAQSPRTYAGKLQKATVYVQGAHLFYSESITLNTGNNDLIFESISPNINPSSLQASCKGAIIMDIKHQVKYKEKTVAPRHYDRDIERTTDSIEEVNYALKDIQYKVSVLEMEKNMLLNNRIIKGQPLRDSLALLKDGMLFLKEKLNSIYEQSLKLERQKNKLDKLKLKLEQRLQNFELLQNGTLVENQNGAMPIHQIHITLFAEAPTATQINFNYLVSGAGWTPIYDLQANSGSQNFNLKYFANVTQNTGLEWSNIPLTLSTGNPNESNTKPELNPWYLSFLEYYRQNQHGYKGLSNANAPMQAESLQFKQKDKKERSEDMDDASLYLQKYVQISENMLRTEYEIKLSYTIASDSKVHKVLIHQKDVPMLMQYAAVPKMCTDAFLMAKVAGWEDLNVVPGMARLYFDGAYVGEMFLNTSVTSDTLDMNLGRDKSIVLTRKKVKENYKEKILSDEKIETRSIEIVIKNTKNSSIDIKLEDQIPIVTGTNEIKVVLVEADGATLEESSGKLSWNLKLKSKDSKKVVFTYQIKYPKGKELAGL